MVRLRFSSATSGGRFRSPPAGGIARAASGRQLPCQGSFRSSLGRTERGPVIDCHYARARHDCAAHTESGRAHTEKRQKTAAPAKQTLPDQTFTVTRYVACAEKDGKVLCIARLVYVHRLYSYSSAVARSSSESGAASAEAACVRQWLSRRERVEAVSLPSRASFLSISVSKGLMRLLDARAPSCGRRQKQPDSPGRSDFRLARSSPGLSLSRNPIE